MQAKIGMYVGKSVELENNLISLQDEYNKLNTSKTEETEKLTKEIQSLENKLATTEQLIKDLNSSVGTVIILLFTTLRRFTNSRIVNRNSDPKKFAN